MKVAGALHACPADPTEDDSAQTPVIMPLKMGYNSLFSGHGKGGALIVWSLAVLPQTSNPENGDKSDGGKKKQPLK